MSRVGKHPVNLPSGVTVELGTGSISVKGPKGTLQGHISSEVEVKVEGNAVVVSPKSETLKSRANWGTTRRNINKMVLGVTDGFKRTLDINGVGYKAALSSKGDMLRLTLGFSHEILYIPAQGVKLEVTKPTQIIVSGIDDQVVGQTAAEIRAFKKPEPFKGKGIKYENEVILRKEGKKK